MSNTLIHSVFTDWIFRMSYEYDESQVQEIFTDHDSLIGGCILQLTLDKMIDYINKYSFNPHKAGELMQNLSNSINNVVQATLDNENWFVQHRTYHEADGEWEVDDEWEYIYDIYKILNF